MPNSAEALALPQEQAYQENSNNHNLDIVVEGYRSLSWSSVTEPDLKIYIYAVGYRWTCFNEPVFMEWPQALLIKFGIHHIVECWVVIEWWKEI